MDESNAHDRRSYFRRTGHVFGRCRLCGVPFSAFRSQIFPEGYCLECERLQVPLARLAQRALAAVIELERRSGITE